MKKRLVVVGVVVAALCWPAVGVEAKAEATRRSARAAFEAAWAPSFEARRVLPAERADKEYADFTATGVVWAIALPVDSDSRLRFVKATFGKDGTFASGTMAWMGLPEVKLSADDFAALRRDFPMLAVCDRKDAPACLFRPPQRQMSKRVPAQHAVGLMIDPLRELYGEAFLEALKRLRVDYGSVRCRVDNIGPDGMKFPLGTVGVSQFVESLDDKKVLAAVGAARPDLISERDRVEYHLKGTITYEMVLPETEKEVRK